MKVKVCGITDSENLQEVLKTNPDYVGFIFYPKSKRYVVDKTVLKQLDNYNKAVGVFVNEQLDIVLAISQNNNISTVQLHGHESHEYCSELKQSGLRVIKAFNLHDEFDFSQLKPYLSCVDYFLFDTKGNEHGGNGVKFNWNILNDYNLNVPFFLSGGISGRDVDNIQKLSHPKLYGVDINSGFETSPGIKDAQTVDRFIKNLNQL